MAILRHPETGEKREIDGEIPFHAIYRVEGTDDDGELWEEDRVDIEGTSWIVEDSGSDTFETGPSFSASQGD